MQVSAETNVCPGEGPRVSGHPVRVCFEAILNQIVKHGLKLIKTQAPTQSLLWTHPRPDQAADLCLAGHWVALLQSIWYPACTSGRAWSASLDGARGECVAGVGCGISVMMLSLHLPVVDANCVLSSLLSPRFPPLLSEVRDMGVPKGSSSFTGNLLLPPLLLLSTLKAKGKGVPGRAVPIPSRARCRLALPLMADSTRVSRC